MPSRSVRTYDVKAAGMCWLWLSGMTLREIGALFGRDHRSVNRSIQYLLKSLVQYEPCEPGT